MLPRLPSPEKVGPVRLVSRLEFKAGLIQSPEAQEAITQREKAWMCILDKKVLHESYWKDWHRMERCLKRTSMVRSKDREAP